MYIPNVFKTLTDNCFNYIEQIYKEMGYGNF